MPITDSRPASKVVTCDPRGADHVRYAVCGLQLMSRWIMRISERGQVTIPKRLRDRFGMNRDVEVEITPTEDGLLIRKQSRSQHPVERISGILDGRWPSDIDQYIDEIRGR